MIRFLRVASLFVLALFLMSFGPVGTYRIAEVPGSPNPLPERPTNRPASILFKEITEKYEQWGLCGFGLHQEAFRYAMIGYSKLKEQGKLLRSEYLTIIDFSQPSSLPRLFLLNVETGKILYKSLVAHGRNSGRMLAQSFSNKESSLESSPGFYVTDETYIGKNGYSLRLKGCEKGFNDNAYRRGIVMHGADYVSENFIKTNGFLGRSHGCPAVPTGLNKKIIDVIKGGSCMFIYFPNEKYLCGSPLLEEAS